MLISEGVLIFECFIAYVWLVINCYMLNYLRLYCILISPGFNDCYIMVGTDGTVLFLIMDQLLLIYFNVSNRELHRMYNNCNNASCNTLFSMPCTVFIYCTACTNPLYSLLLVQCQFYWFFLLLKLRPLRMRSRAARPLRPRFT